MALLIDGYNLLNVTDLFGMGSAETALAGSRQALLDFLASALDERTRKETTIVFDAAGAPPGLPRTMSQDGMTIHFARRYANADEMLEELIESEPAPKSLIVVSSDHRVQRAARRRGAAFVDSDKWYSDLRASRRDQSTPPDKLTPEPSPEEVAYWLERFDTKDEQGNAGPKKRRAEE